MITLNRILVPTDFSEFSRRAMDYACAMASRFESELHLLHISPAAEMLIPEAAALGAENLVGHSEALEQAAKAQLDRLPPGGWENGKPIIRATRIGAPFLEIVQYARDEEIDLIVLGTHGRSGLMHLLMGSVAENVVRKAPCPVMTVKPEGHQFVMP
ncbi:MAG: universal stress protein [Planctomycetaceae bacterium]